MNVSRNDATTHTDTHIRRVMNFDSFSQSTKIVYQLIYHSLRHVNVYSLTH